MGSASQPGDVLSQEPYTVTGEGWKRIIFSQPVLIGPSADKWVSVQITHIADEFPIGTDSGPAVPTKGDWIYAGGWDELRNFNFDYNWNVVAIVYTYDASYDVDAGGPYTGVIGEEPVQFNGTATGGIWPYYWNWDFGDGSTSELEDPVHSYARPGNYNVTLEGFDSDLSGDIDTTTVTVTVAPRFEVTPLSGGIGINTVIKNNGSGNATNLQWTIKVTGGFLGLINKTFTKTIPTLAVGKETKVRTGMFFGFGSIYITFSATCDQNRSAHQIADGKIVLFWVNIG
jgi:PKD repeat protein